MDRPALTPCGAPRVRQVARAASVHDAVGNAQTGAPTQAVFLSPLFADAAAGLFVEVSLFDTEQLEIRSGQW